jgi:hypothetical protein
MLTTVCCLIRSPSPLHCESREAGLAGTCPLIPKSLAVIKPLLFSITIVSLHEAFLSCMLKFSFIAMLDGLVWYVMERAHMAMFSPKGL